MMFNSEVKIKLYGSNFKEASQEQIKEEINTWNQLQITIFWENLRELKKELFQDKEKIDFSYFIFPSFESQQLSPQNLPAKAIKAFNFWNEQEEVSFAKEVSFYKAIFMGDINFQSTLFKEAITFSNIIFYGNCNFSKTHFLKSTTFMKTQFRGEADIYNSIFEQKVTFDESGFHARTVFHQCQFKDESCFSLVSSKYRITFFSCFAKRISFKYSRIDHAYFVKNHFNYLTFHGIAIENPFFSDNKIDEAERETYAYIKHFFDDKKDYISANYYYEQEMLSYQKELFPKSKASFFKKIQQWFSQKNLGDKVIFGFSKLASNFGKNIFLPFYWILFAGALFVGLNTKENVMFMTFSLLLLSILILTTSLFRKLTKQKKREDLIWLLAQTSISLLAVGLWLNEGQFISDFAKVINPVQILKTKDPYCHGIELSCLLIRVFIATMVYHFIIASKRGVKR